MEKSGRDKMFDINMYKEPKDIPPIATLNEIRCILGLMPIENIPEKTYKKYDYYLS